MIATTISSKTASTTTTTMVIVTIATTTTGPVAGVGPGSGAAVVPGSCAIV